LPLARLSLFERVLPLGSRDPEEAATDAVKFQTLHHPGCSYLSDPQNMQVVRDSLPRIRRNVAFAKHVAHHWQRVALRRQTARLQIETELFKRE
jgi:hypothetical protein